MDKIKKLFRSGVLQGHLQSKFSNIKKAPLMLVRHDANCGYKYQGKVYSPIIDSIVDLAYYHGFESSSVAKPYSKFFGVSAYNDPAIFNRNFLRISLFAAVLERMIGTCRALKYKRDASIRVWGLILDRVRPAVVIGIQPSRYLCAACKSVGIPVYDYQHGVIASGHWWYGNLLPREISDDELPTGILCWDRISASALESWAPERGVCVRVLGNPWFIRFENKKPHDCLVQEALDKCINFDNGKPSILVSLQWGLGELYYAGSDFNGVMCDALSRVIKNTHHRYNWMLRLHPVQLHRADGKETLEYIEREFGHLDGVEWEETSRLPLPVVLTVTQLHITDMSTVVTEAAWHGIPSAVLNPFLRKGERLETLFKEERVNGIATLVEQTESAIEQWILSFLESRYLVKEVESEEKILEFLKEHVSVDCKIKNKDYC